MALQFDDLIPKRDKKSVIPKSIGMDFSDLMPNRTPGTTGTTTGLATPEQERKWAETPAARLQAELLARPQRKPIIEEPYDIQGYTQKGSMQTYSPIGEKYVKPVVEKGVDVLRKTGQALEFPFVGLGGITNLIAGEGLKKASEDIKARKVTGDVINSILARKLEQGGGDYNQATPWITASASMIPDLLEMYGVTKIQQRLSQLVKYKLLRTSVSSAIDKMGKAGYVDDVAKVKADVLDKVDDALKTYTQQTTIPKEAKRLGQVLTTKVPLKPFGMEQPITEMMKPKLLTAPMAKAPAGMGLAPKPAPTALQNAPELITAIHTPSGFAEPLKLSFRGSVNKLQIEQFIKEKYPNSKIYITEKLGKISKVKGYRDFDVQFKDKNNNLISPPKDILNTFKLGKNFFRGTEPEILPTAPQPPVSGMITPSLASRQPAVVKPAITPMPKPSPLIEEARKYKTAEEFVNSKPVYYHGRTTSYKGDIPSSIRGTSLGDVYFTDSESVAKKYSLSSTPKATTSDILEARKTKGYNPNITKANIDIKNPMTDETTIFDIFNEDELIEDLKQYDSSLDYAEFWDKQEKRAAINKILDNTSVENSNSSLPQNLKRIFGYVEDMGGDAKRIKSKYDGMIFSDEESGGNTVVPFSRNQIKTHSQLTDIWNQATSQGVKPSILKSERGAVNLDIPITPENMKAIETKWDNIREFVDDDWLRVKKLIQRKGTIITETNNPYEAEIRYWGRLGTRVEEADNIIVGIDKDILSTSRTVKVPDAELSKEINQYLIARHAPERNAALGEKAAGITNKEAEKILTDIASKPYAKEVERIANEIQNLNNKTLDVLLESGVIDKTLLDTLRTKYKNHVPLNRVMSENDDIVEVLTRKGFGVQGAGLKRAFGSEKEVADILTNVVTNYKSALARSEKNIIDNHTLRFVRDNKYFDGLFEEVELPVMPVGKVTHKAAIDIDFMNQLKGFAQKLGAKLKTTGQPGRILGKYYPAGKQITRKFATPREVISHETAHFFDDKFGLKQRFYKRGQTKAIAEEMISHMQRSGESVNRMGKAEERFADAFEWWLTHRDLAKQDLPLFSKEMDNIIKEIPSLNPLLDIRPTPKLTIEEMEETIFARQKFTTDPNILPLREEGKQVYLKINDPQLAMALRGVNRQKVEGLIRGVKLVTRFYAGLATRFNPEFAFSNKVRDIQETLVYLASKKEVGVKGALKTAIKDPESIKDVTDYIRGKKTKGTELYHQMKMDGGTTGGMGLSTRKELEIDLGKIRNINRSNPRKAAQIVLKAVDDWNTIFEDSTRLSVYKQALAQGASRNRAAVLAKEASVNFNKMGTGMPVVNALYMFSNASVRGSVKMLKAMRDPKVAGIVLTLLGGSIYIVNEYNDTVDENWREKVSKWDHLNSINIVIPTNDGIRYFSIPISWGLKPIKVMLDTVYNVAFDKKTDIGEAVGNIATSVIEGYNPVGGTDAISAITPTILDLPVDLARNKAWHGGRIKPDWNPSDPESIKYFDKLKLKAMGRAAIYATKELGEKGIEISPADINYSYEQLIGGTGRATNKIINTIVGVAKGEVETKEIPFVSRFYRDIPEEKIFSESADFKTIKNLLKKQSKERFYLNQEAEILYESMKTLPPDKANYNHKKMKTTNPQLYDKLKDIASSQKRDLDYNDRLILQLGVENGQRARFIFEKTKTMPDRKAKNEYIRELRNKKIVTDKVIRQLKFLNKSSPK